MVDVDRALLRSLREERGLSISDLAARLGYKTPTGYWLLEQNGNNRRKLSVENLYQLSLLYEMPMESFLTVTEE